jgi:hypothetical protein
MGPAQRQSLFLSLYPSDLTFVEEAHRNVMRDLKVAESVRSDLVDRITKLKEAALSEQELAQLKATVAFYKEHHILVLNNLAVVQHKIAEIGACAPDIKERYLSRINNIKQIHYELFKLTRGSSEYSQQAIDSLSHINATTLATLSAERKNNLEKQHQTHTDLLEITTSLDQNSTWSVDEIIAQIDSARSERKVIFVTDVVVASIPDAVLTVDLPNLTDLVARCIDAMREEFLTGQDLMQLNLQLERHRAELLSANTELTIVQTMMCSTQEQIDQCNQLIFNLECSLACPAREGHSSKKDKLIAVMSEHTLQSEKLEIKIADLNQMVDNAESVSRNSEVVRNVYMPVAAIEKSIYSVVHLTPTIDSMSGFLKQISSEKTLKQQHNRAVELDTYLESLQSRLELLKILGGNLDALRAREKKLTDQLEQLKEINCGLAGEVETLIHQKKELDQIQTLRKRLFSYLQEGIVESREFISAMELEQLTRLKDYLSHCSNQLSKDLIELERKYDTVNKINIRLVDELYPALRQVEQNIVRLGLVAEQTSPQTGIIRDVMIEFVNIVLDQVNDILLSLAAYPMKVCALDTQKAIDYKFPIQIHEIHRPVPDLKFLSNGQKAIFNFAFYLAVMEIRGFLSEYAIKIDEIDAGWSYGHKERLINTIADLISRANVKRLLMVNHHPAVYTAIADLNIVCLDTSGVVIPAQYNTSVKIQKVDDVEKDALEGVL